MDTITYTWRGWFSNPEVHDLHAEAFHTRLYDESDWNWVGLCNRHSLGWVVARDDDRLVGFLNVLWDGLVHAYLEDVMVAADARHRGVGVGLVHAARDGVRAAGCDFLHVSFDEKLRPFYVDACGFSPVVGGLMDLTGRGSVDRRRPATAGSGTRRSGMGERTSYAPGTPSWVDLGSPDTAAAATFYGGLFGWSAEIDPRPDAGGYGMFTLQGKQVAGLGPQMNTDMPPYWTVYVTVADADATLEAVTANGGTIVMGPMDVFDAGRMGVIQDPMGSYISIWQPLGMIGAQLVNEPGAFAWNELATTDLAAANRFYGAVFGWGLHPEGSGEHSSLYTVGEDMVCGAHVAGEGEFPAWSVWFASADCDASVAKVEELGGSAIMPPNDMEFGRGAVVADPQGAVFGLGTMKEPAP